MWSAIIVGVPTIAKRPQLATQWASCRTVMYSRFARSTGLGKLQRLHPAAQLRRGVALATSMRRISGSRAPIERCQ
jgi:hypothetical protein